MRSFILTVLVFCWTTPAHAQVEIPTEIRAENISPGYCGWCCLQTIGKHQKCRSLYDILANRCAMKEQKILENGKYVTSHPGGMSTEALLEELDRRRLSYHIQEYGCTGTTIIEEANKEHKGCIVVLVNYTDIPNIPERDKDLHAVIITSFLSDSIVMIDPNDPAKNIEKTRKWFQSHWNGFAFVLGPN